MLNFGIPIFGDKATSSVDGISSQVNLKIRVDGEGRSITEPINISQQCIVYRGGRQGCDLIRDEVIKRNEIRKMLKQVKN